MIQPTVGRVVYFVPKASKYEFGFCLQAGKPHAALVTCVHSDSCVNLAVFDANGKTFPATSVQLYQDAPTEPAGDYCTWMPYQKGQAAKTEALEKSIASAK